MTTVAFWDTETDGLLDTATKVHCIGVQLNDTLDTSISAADHEGYVPNVEAAKALCAADIRVAHNAVDFDERIMHRFYPNDWTDEAVIHDTLLISRLLYPNVYSQAPNTYRVPPKLRMSHGIKAWGYRLGEHKGDYSDRTIETLRALHPELTEQELASKVWEKWTPEMQAYMDQDVTVLRKLYNFLMKQKPAPRALEVEHKFAAIMRRQEAWGFTFNHTEALKLEAELVVRSQALEASLIADFGGHIWVAGKEQTPKATRNVKLQGFPDVTVGRVSAKGKPLKPYVGPPLCTFEAGSAWTPVSLEQFNPTSSAQVERMLRTRYNWKPTKRTKKGNVCVDDEVLRSLPWPECPKLADLYAINKIWSYVAKGQYAWLKTCREEKDDATGTTSFRQHGWVNTIGTYTFRCSHSSPNLAQVPTRSEEFGHRCRSLFTSRPGFVLVGFDGSSMQLRLMAHHMARFDAGRYARVFVEGQDPHEFMRDSIGVDLMGEGPAGRAKGKTIDYALPFGGGELRLGAIIRPLASDEEKRRIGKLVKARLGPTFGDGFEALKKALTVQVESKGYLIGLDGRRAWVNKAHIALSTLLQMGEAIVMRHALVIMDEELKSRGLRCGVDRAGLVHAEFADYEFCANVHDEAQADVREQYLEVYREVALWCVSEAGRRLDLKCPLKSDVKVGTTWQETH